jgi:hypothetical protein
MFGDSGCRRVHLKAAAFLMLVAAISAFII